MRQFVLSVVMGVGVLVTGNGCGNDGGGLSGSAEATMASCNAYCTAYVSKSCTDPIYTSFADCLAKNCDVIIDVPDRCQATMQAYFDCRKGQADLCADSGCRSELSATGVCM